MVWLLIGLGWPVLALAGAVLLGRGIARAEVAEGVGPAAPGDGLGPRTLRLHEHRSA